MPEPWKQSIPDRTNSIYEGLGAGDTPGIRKKAQVMYWPWRVRKALELFLTKGTFKTGNLKRIMTLFDQDAMIVPRRGW